jgi:hypothetical protein
MIRAIFAKAYSGAIAQLGEHLLCKQGVGGSIPPGSTKLRPVQAEEGRIEHPVVDVGFWLLARRRI